MRGGHRMRRKKEKGLVLALCFLLLPLDVLLAQTEESLKILEKNKDGVISLSVIGENKEVVAKGTGFVLENGVIATSFLLLSQAKSVEGLDSLGKKVKIESILAVDKSLFIVLLKSKGKQPPLILGNSEELKIGKEIFAIGSSESGELKISDGKVSNFLEVGPGRKFIDTTLSIFDSYSGGPLIDANGQVFGLNIFLGKGVKFVIPSNLLKTIQKTMEIKFKDWRAEDYLSTQDGAFLAGKISFLLDETGSAEKYFGLVVKASPENIEAHYLLASVYNRQRGYEGALSEYRKVVELDPNRDDAHYGMGLVYFNMRRFKEAVLPLEKAVQLNSEHKEAYFLIGNAYEEQKEFSKAAEFYEKFIASNPGQKIGEANLRLAMCLFELGQFEKASSAFQEALKDNPQDIYINQRLAQSYQKAGQYEKAEEVFKFLAQLSPPDAVNYYRVILRMYDEARLSQKAVEAAKKIAEMTPEDADALYNLALMYMRSDRYKEAVEAFNKVLELRPNFEYVYVNLGTCYMKLSNWNKYIDTFKRLVGLFPENPDGWFNIGVGYMQLKRYEYAVEPFLTAIDLKPDYGVAYFNLGITYLNIGENARAREIYRKLMNIDSELAQRLRKVLR